jgi:hypothetical protein
VKEGSIFFQAFPHNAQPGTYESSLFEASLQQAVGDPVLVLDYFFSKPVLCTLLQLSTGFFPPTPQT